MDVILACADCGCGTRLADSFELHPNPCSHTASGTESPYFGLLTMGSAEAISADDDALPRDFTGTGVRADKFSSSEEGRINNLPLGGWY